jgi:putrescine aminotransferase
LACAAAIAAIHVTLRDRLWEVAAAKGNYLLARLNELAGGYPAIFDTAHHGSGVTGRGLLIGLHFCSPEMGYKVAAGLFRRGVLVAGSLTSAHTVRIEPPLVITQEQIDAVLERLAEALAEVNRTL